MGQKPPVQKPQEDPTAWIKLEDQSLASTRAAVSVPFGMGEHKTVGLPITPIYGWREIKTSTNLGKGGKGGTQVSRTYRGTIAYVFGRGPGWSLEWILFNGARVWDGHIMRGVDEDYVDITFPGYGQARWYWGTETQVADPLLASYAEQPAYRGFLVLVLRDCSFGPNGETQAPTIEACWRRIPEQSIVDNTGGAASNDGAFSANGVVCAAEILTGWDWLELSPSLLNAATFQATADALELLRAEGQDESTDSDRSAVATSPMWTSRVEARAALVLLARATNAWFRQGADGRIEAGYWKRSVDLDDVTDLGPDDATELTDPTRGDAIELNNSFVVEFTNSGYHHKGDAITVNNHADIRNRGIRRQTLKREDLLREYQARIAGNEARRNAEIPDLSITLKVRRAKCRNPDGSRIRPGDYFRYPLRMHPTESETMVLFRCVRREFDPIGEITLVGELEKLAPLSAVVPDEPVVSVPIVMPPVYFRRLISFRHEDYLPINSPLFVLAAKPDTSALSFRVLYGETEDGDFVDIGGQPSYALPLSLPQAVASSDATIRVKLLPVTASGADPRRDAATLTDWQGGATEGRNDDLLLILIAKSGGAITAQEICSVNGPATVVATDTYDVPVRRGRRWSTARAFSSGSFPDAFSNYEAWLIRRDQLQPMWHNDFTANPLTGARSDIWIRYTPIGLNKVYDGVSAFAEVERRTDESIDLAEYEFQTDETHQPTDPFSWPAANGQITTYDDLFPPYLGGSHVYSYRQRGGTATLIGFSEYASPSSPPKKYLLQTRYNVGSPGIRTTFGPADFVAFDNHGDCSYDAVTGAGPTNSGGLTYTPGLCAGTTDTSCAVAGAIGCAATITPTQYENNSTGATFYWAGCDAGLYTSEGRFEDGFGWRLSNEDTEENAISRSEAAFGAWGGWTVCPSFECANSIHSVRTSGFSVTYQWAQFQDALTGALPSADFLVTVKFHRVHTVTSASDYFDMEYEVSTDGSGNAALEIDVPIEAGYSIKVAEGPVWHLLESEGDADPEGE